MLESADVDDDVVISPTDGPGEGAFALPSTGASAEVEEYDGSDSGTEQEIGAEDRGENEAGLYSQRSASKPQLGKCSLGRDEW